MDSELNTYVRPKTRTYRGVGTTVELYGAPLRLVVLESSSLVAGVAKVMRSKKGACPRLLKS